MVVDTLGRDLRYALRVLSKAPGFTLAAVATLSLGIGANTAIVSVIRTVLIQRLPYAEPDTLAMVWLPGRPGDLTWLSLQEVMSYGEEVASVTSFGAYTETTANLTGGDEPERVRAAAVTGNLLAVLGIEPTLGRALTAADSEPGAPETVVLGHGLWQRRFGGAPDIVGRTIPVNGRRRTVVGVLPASFRLPLDFRASRPSELLIPLTIDRATLGQWGNRSYFGVARLASGVPASQASSEFALLADRWVAAGYVKDDGDGGLRRSAVPMVEFITGDARRPLLVLLAAVAVVLLIACANVVNLLLARADARRREVVLRAALGAERRDLVRQLLTESAVLAALGALAGLMLANGALSILRTLRPSGLPRIEDATLDPATLASTAAVALALGVLFGLAPALRLSRERLAGVLNDGGRGGAPGRTRHGVRRGLVVAQLAGSVVLVVGAALLVRTLLALQAIDLGFDTRHVLTASVQLPPADYPTPRVVDFFRRLTAQLAAQPGITAAGAVRVLPLARTIGDWSISIEGRPTAPNENPNGDYQSVTPGYFVAMGTTLLRGRLLTEADREDAPPVVVINDTMSARYWPGQDAIGRRFQMGGAGSRLPLLTIVGIVRTSRHNTVVEEPRAEMYLPHAQTPMSVGSPPRAMALVVKTTGDPLAAAGMLRREVRALDPNLPVADVQALERVAASALAGPRFAAVLLGLFAGLALTLAAIGTYATVALLVSERAQEIGIRLALGAERRVILQSVLGEGLVLAGVGAGIGLAGALAATRLISALLYGVSPLDPLTFVSVPLMLAFVVLVASLTPARRAASVDPVATLRHG
jgi:predicted permease